MLELGQPNHPYDLAARRRAPASASAGPATGETLVTLDDVERTFTPDDLLICDGRRRPDRHRRGDGRRVVPRSPRPPPTCCSEMAWFRPCAVATTARRLGLRSEASARFEKGCDPEVIDWPAAASRSCRRDLRRDARRRGRSTSGASCPTARRSGCAPAGSTRSSAPTWRRARSGRPARAHRLRRTDGRSGDGDPTSPSRRGATTRDRDRRRRGGRPPPRLRHHRPHGARRRPHRRLTDRPAGAAPRCAPCWWASGWPR